MYPGAMRVKMQCRRGNQFATSVQVINDGVSIARAIELADPFENAGAQLIKEVRLSVLTGPWPPPAVVTAL